MRTVLALTHFSILSACLAPALAMAPPQCYISNSSCSGTCGSSSQPIKRCQEPPLPATPGSFAVNSWQEVQRFCNTYEVSVLYDCDESIEPGWAPTGCNPGGGICCKGDLDSAIPDYGYRIEIPMSVSGCFQPGGPN